MKRVLISGGSKGLGQGLVQAFLQEGHRVATFSRSESNAVLRWQKQYPDRFYYRCLDMTDVDACAEYLRGLQEHWGDVEILVNNAGQAQTSLLALEDDQSIEKLVGLNLTASMQLTRKVVRPMLALGWGRVINISSIVGLDGYRGLSVYSATKAALDGFTRSLARELGARNITVNSVAPGYLDTDMTEELEAAQRDQIVRRTPLGRLGRPQDVAAMVLFLADDEAGFITGQTFVVDGGISA